MKEGLLSCGLTVFAFLMGMIAQSENGENKPDVVHLEPAVGITAPVKVIEVYDGDTVICEVKYRCRVRLIDCWAPEVKGEQKAHGERAKRELQQLCERKSGYLFVPWHDDIGKMTSMGRILGKLIVNGDDMSHAMVQSGMATKTKEENIERWGEP